MDMFLFILSKLIMKNYAGGVICHILALLHCAITMFRFL
uniref:Uncharacterized protein n=1 Tax=Rhizophora mucronata TaxID=61149 RepID=A0A2P2QB07_RHIMU